MLQANSVCMQFQHKIGEQGSISFVACDITEVYAAREKNGIYLPRERYFQDEAEKKVN